MTTNSVLSVAAAQHRVLEQVRPLPPERLALAATLGLVLAEDIVSDIDMPPYDKAMMDGYAVRAADVAKGSARLIVIEEVTAGSMPKIAIGPGQATRIMTGAPIPSGADAVVMVERTQPMDRNRVQIDEAALPGQNVLRRAKEMREGEVLLKAGVRIRPQEIGLLALVGRTKVRVQPAPQVAILPTGDELVEPGQRPGPAQIRNSNGPMLLAQAMRAGGTSRLLTTARDNAESLGTQIAQGLKANLLVLSGGVSAGKLDLVPEVLTSLGVKTFFHKVEMKPGKPMLFGVKQNEDDKPATLVFALPGNPVASMVCFELFVRPALCALMGLPPGPRFVRATLMDDYAYRTDRPTYHPAILETVKKSWNVRLPPWFGSPDLRGVTAANAFALLPVGDHLHRAGDELTVLKVESG